MKNLCNLALGLILSLILFYTVYAAAPAPSPYKLIVPFPGATEITGPADYIQKIYTFALGFGTLLAMGMIIFGAVEYTLSEAVTKKEDAKDRIMGAIWGLVLLLAATLILNTINPQLPELREPALTEIPTPSTLPSVSFGQLTNVAITGNTITWQYPPVGANLSAPAFLIQFLPPGQSNWSPLGQVGAGVTSFTIAGLPGAGQLPPGSIIQFRVVPVVNGRPIGIDASNPIPFIIGGGGSKNN